MRLEDLPMITEILMGAVIIGLIILLGVVEVIQRLLKRGRRRADVPD
jgi:hypothetical protein